MPLFANNTSILTCDQNLKKQKFQFEEIDSNQD